MTRATAAAEAANPDIVAMAKGLAAGYVPLGAVMARGDLVALVEDAEILHYGGGAIGTGASTRLPSTLAAYFTHRNLLPCCARWATKWLPLVYMVAWYRMLRYFLRPNALPQFFAALRGLHMLGPPKGVKARLPAIVAKTGNVAKPPNHRVW